MNDSIGTVSKADSTGQKKEKLSLVDWILFILLVVSWLSLYFSVVRLNDAYYRLDRAVELSGSLEPNQR